MNFLTKMIFYWKKLMFDTAGKKFAAIKEEVERVEHEIEEGQQTFESMTPKEKKSERGRELEKKVREYGRDLYRIKLLPFT